MVLHDDLTDPEIDELLRRWELTDPALRRRILARCMADRKTLLGACREALAAPGAAHAALTAAVAHAERKV